jgi:hypothetical protein
MPANCDLAINGLISMIEKVDPDKERTLGVITKADLA